MTLPDEYKIEHSLVVLLANELRNGRLAVLLGSGLSQPFDLPGWDNLIKRLYSSRRAKRDTKSPLLAQAQIFRDRYFKDDLSGFCKALHRALYPSECRIDFEKLRSNLTLAAIGALVMASRRGKLGAVITLNFDDLLEIYLRYHGLVVNSQASFPAVTELADITVIHAHGLIPYKKSKMDGKSIILTEDDYRKVINNVEHPLSQELLTVLRKHTWLFIGLSGEDEHLLKLLAQVSESHPFYQYGNDYWGVAFNDKMMKKKVWESNNVAFFRVRDYHTHLPTLLFNICQKAASESD